MVQPGVTPADTTMLVEVETNDQPDGKRVRDDTPTTYTNEESPKRMAVPVQPQGAAGTTVSEHQPLREGGVVESSTNGKNNNEALGGGVDAPELRRARHSTSSSA